MARLSLHLLGGFRAQLDGDQTLVIPIQKSQALLRQTLFTPRKSLGHPEVLRLVGETVALEPALVAVDVQAFEQAVAQGTRGALEEAAALYHGEFLEGLTLQEPPFEEWRLSERLRLRELALLRDALRSALAGQGQLAAARGSRCSRDQT